MPGRLGVRGRLLAAFFGICAFAVLAAAVAMHSFLAVGEVVNRITQKRVPLALASLELSRHAERTAALAPWLLAITSQAEHEEMSGQIDTQLDSFDGLLVELERTDIDASTLNSIKHDVNSLRLSLISLNGLVVSQLETIGFIEELLADVSDTHRAINRLLAPGTVQAGSAVTFPVNYRLQEETANIAEMLYKAASSMDLDEIQNLGLSLGESLTVLEVLAAVYNLEQRQSLQDRITRLRGLVEGRDGVIRFRQFYLATVADAQRLLEDTVRASRQLANAVDGLVEFAKSDIRDADLEAQSVQRISTWVLIATVVLSLLISVLIIWLYVGRNLIARLTALSDSMLSIAQGNLEADLPSGGNDEIGQMSEALNVFRDTAVEVRETNLREIREARNRLTDAIETIPDGFSLYDADDRLVMCNTTYIDLLYPGHLDAIQPGVPFETTIRRAAEEGVIREAQGRVEDWIAERMDQHRNPGALHVQERDGGVWVRFSERKTEDGGTVAVYTDITELKRAEQEVAEREAQFHVALDNMPGALVYTDEELNIVACNDRFREMYPAPKELLQPGCPYPGFLRYKAEHGYYGDGDVDTLVAQRVESLRNPSDKTFEDRTPDGRVYQIRRRRVATGGAVTVMTDITESKRAEKMLKHAKEEAETLAQLKSDFVAMVSHEIRTPMSGVIGMIELLGQSQLDEDQRQMMATARDSSFVLLQIIDDVLDFSRIEAGKLTLESLPLSLTEVFEGVADTLAPDVAVKDIDFSIFVDPTIPTALMGDPVRLRQILFNLGGNAIKFTRGGKVTIRADLIPSQSDDKTRIRFEVSDTGIGISEEAQATLFQPFIQAESTTTRRFGGTGLGLSICRRLTEMMGGHIGVESTESEGSTFWVEIALDVAAPDTVRTPLDFDLGGVRILVVMADADDRTFFTGYLEHAGCEVSAAASADDALSMASAAIEEGRPFNVAVMGEAGVDGLALRQALSQAGGATPSHAIIVYRHREDDQQDRSREAGFASFIAAPVRRDALLRAVATAMGRASPKIEYIDEYLELTKDSAAKAPTAEEALAEGRLVLLAEDQSTSRQVLLRQLNMLGYAADIVPDGKAALTAWREKRYALLLTDCHMPNMDGFELTRSIRAEEGDDRRLPIIAVTADALLGEAERCLAGGMDDYLSKPVELISLKRTLKKWMPAGKRETGEEEDEHVAISALADGGDGPIDLSVLAGLVGDDPAFILEMLEVYVSDNRKAHMQLSAAIESREAEEVTAAGHRLKGLSRIAGVGALAELGALLETAGRKQNWREIKRLVPQAEAASREAIAFVDEFRKTVGDEGEER